MILTIDHIPYPICHLSSHQTLIYIYIYIYIYLFIYLFICLFITLFVYLYVYVYHIHLPHMINIKILLIYPSSIPHIPE